MFSTGFEKTALTAEQMGKAVGTIPGIARQAWGGVKRALTPSTAFQKSYNLASQPFDPAVRNKALTRYGVGNVGAATPEAKARATEAAKRVQHIKGIREQAAKGTWFSRHPIMGTAGATAVAMKTLGGGDASQQPSYVGYPQPGQY